MARNLKQCLVEELNELDTFDKDGLLERRYERLMSTVIVKNKKKSGWFNRSFFCLKKCCMDARNSINA